MRHATALALAIVSALVFFTYMLKLPFALLPQHTAIVKEYYYEKMFPNALFDILFVLLYLCIALYACDRLHIETHNRPLVVAIVTAILTAAFCLYFTAQKRDDTNFFSKWFYEVGYKSVVYDVLLLTGTFVVYQFLLDSAAVRDA